MKRFIYSIAALVAVFCWGCSNHALEDIQENSFRNDDVKMLSRSVGTIDYSQYTLLENRTVMPRTGESYQGTVTYKGTGFPVYIFWDFDFENYNLFAYISGYNTSGELRWTGDYWANGGWQGAGYYDDIYQLAHVASYTSECSSSRFDFIIKCNFSSYRNNGASNNPWVDYRHVSFHVAFFPGSRDCSCEILEDGEGWWRDPDMEL